MAIVEEKVFELQNSKKLLIRTPNIKDAAKLVEFVKQVSIDSKFLLLSEGEFTMTVEQEAEWIRSNAEDPGAVVLIGEIESEIIAITNAKSGNRKRNAHVAHLGTSVAKSFRGQGIGKLMLKELCAWARQHSKIEYLELSIMGENTRAKNLYKGLGFEVMGEIPNAFKYEDGTYQKNIIMSLNVMS